MTEWMEVTWLVAVIGLLIVWKPPQRAQGPKPKPGDDVCMVCGRALLTMHNHGVRVFPRPTTERPKPIPSPPPR